MAIKQPNERICKYCGRSTQTIMEKDGKYVCPTCGWVKAYIAGYPKAISKLLDENKLATA